MELQHSLFLALVFVVSGLICYIVITQSLPTSLSRRIDALLGDTVEQIAPDHAQPSPWERLQRWLTPIAKPALPEGAWERSPLRLRFYNAGFRSMTAPVIYFAAKTVCTFLLPAILLFVLGFSDSRLETTSLLTVLLILAAAGYYLPNLILVKLIAHRQRELFEAFPDALDLMRVCIEAGLGLDAAIDRVGREIALESPALAEEFHLVSLELRAGASRADALRNLALRVAIEDIDTMTATLIQADRFGTSIAESLRVYAESLRTKRRLVAEEAAAKLPVKLLVPLIFCVFPALLTVLLGPAVISVYRILLPRFTG